LVGQIGQKIFTDLYALAPSKAALCIMALTIIVAANNMVVNLMLKLFGDRRKAVILCGVALSLAGVLLGKYVFAASAGVVCFMIAAILIAFPAGFFPMFSTVAKELNPERYTAMSVAFLNFMAFVFISSYQNIVGLILKSYPTKAGSLAFPVEAYSSVFTFFIIGAVVSTIAALLVPETRDRSVE
jgi:MFS family permease